MEKEDRANWVWLAPIDLCRRARTMTCVTGSQTHLLLATFVASSLDARLPLLLVVVSSEVVVPIGTARAASNHADRAPLALCSAIGPEAGGMGETVAPDRDGACRAHGGGRASIAMSMGVLSLGLGCRACGAGSGGCRAVHALTARWRRWAAGGDGERRWGRGEADEEVRGPEGRSEGGMPLVSATAAQRSYSAAQAGPSNSPGTLANGSGGRAPVSRWCCHSSP